MPREIEQDKTGAPRKGFDLGSNIVSSRNRGTVAPFTNKKNDFTVSKNMPILMSKASDFDKPARRNGGRRFMKRIGRTGRRIL